MSAVQHTEPAARGRLRLAVFGSGTSMGVPTLACHCAVCESTDPCDRRTRPSVMFSYNGRNVLVDTTPDFRFQAMHAKLDRLDAILFTHAHADHILGLDDIRPYNLKQRSTIPIYASEDTLKILRRTFAYIFEPPSMPSSMPEVETHALSGSFELFDAPITVIPAMHGPLPVLGFRIGSIAYLTDFSTVPESSKKLLHGLEHFVLSAIRYTPHPMHSTVDQSLRLVQELEPSHAWFTHICHDLGHKATNAKLPKNVQLAYDGLSFEVAL